MKEESVKVAVRVRPFNAREKARSAQLIVKMKADTTTLTDPDNPKSEHDNKSFTFDHSYWSHDGFTEMENGYAAPDLKHANGKAFADQKKVFGDLGEGILTNAWQGYNSTLFAYGQTGSGKSYSVVGYGANKGIVPVFCERLFQGIEREKRKKNVTAQFEVTFSMLEIYNEVVHDLLNAKQAGKKGGLKVRQHPAKGFYAEGLTTVAVGSFADIEQKIDEGTTNRTVAATNMNATSSRAHTIVGITFIQKMKNASGQETSKTSVTNLVDLAGSERASSTGATGERLKEGAAINVSLSALGNCIASLAEKAQGKPGAKVPYRDSVLTKLLKSALAGNSKTIMVASISPADINYAETLSTLRYADRAKQIKTQVTVNESATDKLIRNLQEENEKLKNMLNAAASGGSGVPSQMVDTEYEEGMTEEEKLALRKELEDDFRAQMEENMRVMSDMKKSFEEKLQAVKGEAEKNARAAAEMDNKRKIKPHIYNVNLDPQLSGKIVHLIEGKHVVGSKKSSESDIEMRGPSMLEKHAEFIAKKAGISLAKRAPAARILVNGDILDREVKLKHNDRLTFGTTQMYVFADPQSPAAKEATNAELITFDQFQEEIVSKSGFVKKTDTRSIEDMLLQEDLMEMLPAVEEVNSISDALKARMHFELMIVSPDAMGLFKGRQQIMVKAVHKDTGHQWTWNRDKFFNRKYVMQEMFQNFQDGEEYRLPPERDPFTEDPYQDIHVGSVRVWLQSLAYIIELSEQLEITDMKGDEVGLLNVSVIPCDSSGREYTEEDDQFLDSTFQLIGKDLHFRVKIHSARGLPNRLTGYYCRYFVLDEMMSAETQRVQNTINPEWKHIKQFNFAQVPKAMVKRLESGMILAQIWGRHKTDKAKASMTSQILPKDEKPKASGFNIQNLKSSVQAIVAKKREQRISRKIEWINKFTNEAEEQGRTRISLKLLHNVLNAKTEEEANTQIEAMKSEPAEKNQTSSGPAPKAEVSVLCSIM